MGKPAFKSGTLWMGGKYTGPETPVEVPPSVFKDASVPKYRPWRLRVPATVARAQRCDQLVPLTWTSRFLAVEYAKRTLEVLMAEDGYIKGHAYMVAAVTDMRKFVKGL